MCYGYSKDCSFEYPKQIGRFCVELVKLLPVHRYIVLIFFHILILLEYWVLVESRTPLKPVLGGVRMVALSISSHEQTQ